MKHRFLKLLLSTLLINQTCFAEITLALDVPTVPEISRPKTIPTKQNLNWSPITKSEFMLLGASTATAIAANLFMSPSANGFKDRISVDETTRDLFRASSPNIRDMIATTSDVTVFALMAVPTVLEAGLVTGGLKHNKSQMWQMLMIDAESFAVTNAINILTKNIVARERPYGRNCDDPIQKDPHCGTKDQNLSFFSGHTSNAFTAAGLICFAHDGHSILDNEALDDIACFGAMAVATATGAMRIVADKHYFSDVLTGALIGFASGYIMPKILHPRNNKKSRLKVSIGTDPLHDMATRFKISYSI